MEKNKILKQFKDAQHSLVIQNSDFSLSVMREMVINRTVDVSPHYQRRDRWGRDKQSRLIESFILNIPVPPIFLSEHEYGSYSVIDGKQRLTAVTQYLDNEFALENLASFPDLNGLRFEDLPREIQQALVMRPYLRVTTLLNQSDPELTFEVFLRLNTGGESLAAQEIRNVAFDGEFNQSLVELSEHPLLMHSLKLKAGRPAKDMSDVEVVLRFLYMNFGGVKTNFMSKDMDEFMRIHKSERRNDFVEAFNRAIERCAAIWGENAFRKPTSDGWRAQFIAPIYDAEMHACHSLSEEEYRHLMQKRDVVAERTRDLFKDDGAFLKSVTQSTNNISAINRRLGTFRSFLRDLANE